LQKPAGLLSVKSVKRDSYILMGRAGRQEELKVFCGYVGTRDSGGTGGIVADFELLFYSPYDDSQNGVDLDFISKK